MTYDEVRIRGVVERHIARILDPIPCFCAPERPELERPEWCVKHLILAGLDVDAIVAEQVALYPIEGVLDL